MKGPRQSRRLQRLMGLMFNISPRKALRLEQLSARFGCNQKTIRRDLELLNGLGYPAVVKDNSVRMSQEGLHKFRAEIARWDPEEEELLEELTDD